MKIYLVRHGETDWNVDFRWQGSTDIELNANGCSQADFLARRIEGFHIDRIYASPLVRAYKTAQAINSTRELEIIKDDRLKEITLGAWEGMTFDEIRAQYTDLFQVWEDKADTSDESDLAVKAFNIFAKEKGIETYFELSSRAMSVLNDIVSDKDNNGKTILIATHGAWIRAVMCNLLHIDLTRRTSFIIGNTSFSTVIYNEEERSFIVETLNDVSHLLD